MRIIRGEEEEEEEEVNNEVLLCENKTKGPLRPLRASLSRLPAAFVVFSVTR